MDQNLIVQLELAGSTYRFRLCRKSETFGQTPIQHCWMPVTPLYAQRQRRSAASGNLAVITEFYWAMCRQEGATHCRDAQERFLLAKLLPRVRSQGSRRIFKDAFLRPQPKAASDRYVAVLEGLLKCSRHKGLTRDEFFESTHVLLGRREFEAGTEEAYRQLTSRLLDRACHLLHGDAIEEAVAAAEFEWQRFDKEFGRRSGQAAAKCALDVLSYEARAALHHCYSLAWSVLLSESSISIGLTPEEVHFHTFWHQDWPDSGAAQRGECLSLFHGHVLGLHPGTGPFLLTATGRELMGAWLSNPLSAECMQRVLHGLVVVLHEYDSLKDEATAERPSPVKAARDGDLDAEEARQHDRRTGRRRK